MKIDFSTYVSPFSWRYGSGHMRLIFSEENKYRLWRQIWVALARVQNDAGLVSDKELADLEKHEKDLDVSRILEIEKETKHDVVAAIREFAEKAVVGGGKIHLGATSMDIVDNADMMRTKAALELVRKSVDRLLALFAEKIEMYARLACIGYTHLQSAEPTTVGYRLAFYAQDLLIDRFMIDAIEPMLVKGKGFKGAVGTAAGYKALLAGTKMTPEEMEQKMEKYLGISSFLITSQVYPRKVDYMILTILSSIAGSVAKFAEDLRILQSSPIGEWSEPFGKNQVGSSAMPFKKNPVNSEKICSLARYLAHVSAIALENATLSHLERTLDDSANRRFIIAEAFLATDEILLTACTLVDGLVIHKERIAYALAQYGPFAATEVIILEAVKNGAHRQKMHELLRTVSMVAWKAMQKGKPNPLRELLIGEKKLTRYVPSRKIEKLLDMTYHIGDAPERALVLVKRIRKSL